MGLSASKQVKSSLSNSSEFTSACDSAYAYCRSLTKHAFPGVFPYQLPIASDHIHSTITTDPNKLPLIVKWVPKPPNRTQIDKALITLGCKTKQAKTGDWLTATEFREWALDLFADLVDGNARKAVLSNMLIGIVGIVGAGAITSSRRELIGATIVSYALGLGASIYLEL